MAERLAGLLILVALVGCEACDNRPRNGNQLIGQYLRGTRDFQQLKLRDRADLSNAQLDGIDLRGAELRGAQFYKADLSMADLRGADLRGARFNDARLAGVRLEGAQLRGATYSEATQFPDGFDPDTHEMRGPPPAPVDAPTQEPTQAMTVEEAKTQSDEWKKWEQLAKTEAERPPSPAEDARGPEIDNRVRCFKGDADACVAAGMKLEEAYRRGENVSLNVRQSFEFLARACGLGKGCGQLKDLAGRALTGIKGVPEATTQRIVREARKLGAGPPEPFGSSHEGAGNPAKPTATPEPKPARDGGTVE